MTDKLTKESARQKFRSSVSIKDIGQVSISDKNLITKWVDAEFSEGLGRIDRYIDKGWNVVYSKDKAKDDRKNVGNQDGVESDIRPSPITRTTKGGHTQILMKIDKNTRDTNQLADAQRDDERLAASRRRKTNKKGSITKISENVDDSDLLDK